ncbi:MAG: UbiD family decarboxylase [Chloroflexi bacterium]|nr:UbiD family decarboxylase [Chloroflexota bacterium]
MPFPHDSVRDAIVDWEAAGELARIKKEVDWNLEAGAIARRALEIGEGKNVNHGGQPAMLFENIKGYPGHSIISSSICNLKRMAIIFGHPNPDKATWRELQDLYIAGLEHPIKPVVVKKAPCKENKTFGNDCNLYTFPAPMIHEGDGGRYMCTYHATITKDKNSDWVNWGMYRHMIHDRRSLGCLFVYGQHGPNMFYQQYEDANEPMPCAIAINPDPLSAIAAASPIPAKMSEVDAVGGWRKKPLELVKCETNDIYVPASSEIVIEGIVPPHVRAYEGPFGEYTGFRASPRDLRPVFVVKCITWRNNPILSMASVGRGRDEGGIIAPVVKSAFYRKLLTDAGWPVKEVHCYPGVADLVIVSVKRGRPRVAQGVAAAIYSAAGGLYSYAILVCDEDTDVFNTDDVINSLVEKVHPERGIWVYHQQGSPLQPSADLKERMDQTGPQIVYDATWPLDWPLEITAPPKVTFAAMYSKELQDKVVKNWTSYGLK